MRAQPGIFFFFLNRQHFVFSCTSPSCFFFILCTVNGIFIILIYLFKLTVFIEILTTVFKIMVLQLFLYSLLDEMVFIYETEE